MQTNDPDLPAGSGAAATACRGAVAGAAAAMAWAALEPAASRIMGTGYTDVSLLGRLVTHRRAWPLVGLGVHLANGAAFGAMAALAGVRTPGAGVAAASVENVAVWPVMGVLDRVHPDRRSGRLGPLLTDGRVFAQETVMHAFFGAVLGALLSRRR